MSLFRKRLGIVLIVFVVVAQGHAPTETRVQKIERWLTAIIRYLPTHIYRNVLEIQDQWTLGHIRRTAIEIVKTEKNTPFDALDIFAYVDLESGWRFWICRDNTASRYSYVTRRWHKVVVSEDCGLTQQNSVYVKGRFWRAYQAEPWRRWKQFLPWVSIRLFQARVYECKEFWGKRDQLITCYHGNSTAYKQRRLEYQCAVLKKLYSTKTIKRNPQYYNPECQGTSYLQAWKIRAARYHGRKAIFKLK